MNRANGPHVMSSLPLGEMTAETFLAEYWQKKPLLIRQAFPGFESPLEPDELAGLACQEGVLSRMIQEKGGDYPWQMRPGPFEGEDFDALGDSHWTILVQEVDRHVPAVADLFDAFSFLPDWRKDDVMISFASKDTGVGAHTDSYDVFLLQGSGRRRWEIGPVGNYSYIPDLDIRMIADFEPSEVYELEAGDMLYLPPGVPHNGVSLEPCLTYSFGFLAPTRSEIITELSDWIAQKSGAARYGDPDRELGASGLIGQADVDRLRDLIKDMPLQTEDLAEWFGGFITRPQRMPADVEEFEGTFEDFVVDFQGCAEWRRHEGVRIAGWCGGSKARLFADGESWDELPAKVVEAFSGRRTWTYEDAQADQSLLKLIYEFTQKGWGYFPEAEEEDDV